MSEYLNRTLRTLVEAKRDRNLARLHGITARIHLTLRRLEVG